MGKQYDWSSRCCLSIKEGFEVASCWQIWVFVVESCFEATTTAAIFRNGANNLPRPMTDWMKNHGVVAWFFHATWGFCIAILTFCRAEPTAQALLPRIPHRLPSRWLPAVAGVVGIVRHKGGGSSVLSGSVFYWQEPFWNPVPPPSVYISSSFAVQGLVERCRRNWQHAAWRDVDWLGPAYVERSDCLYQIVNRSWWCLDHAPDPVLRVCLYMAQRLEVKHVWWILPRWMYKCCSYQQVV